MRREEARGSVDEEGRDIAPREVCRPEFLRCGEARGVVDGGESRGADVVVRMMLYQPQRVASQARYLLVPGNLGARPVVRDELQAGIEVLRVDGDALLQRVGLLLRHVPGGFELLRVCGPRREPL